MQLDRRKQTLLQQIVVTYVHRAEPVGSHFLASQEGLGVRSATIRNELAEMTDLGYLRQPHTSAGRIPSDLGYRYYVDHLMTWDRLSPSEARTVRGSLKMSEGDVEVLLAETCRVLSSLTRYTSVATPPAGEEPSVRQVHLVQLSPRQLLAVVVLEGGQVIHRFTETPRAVPPGVVVQIGNLLDDALSGETISRLPQVQVGADELTAWDDVIRTLFNLICRSVKDEEGGDVILGGASHILEQPEFREADRVEPLVRFLEDRKSAYEMLKRLLAERSVSISIGQEHPHEVMHEVSMVAARYAAGPTSHGWIAVLGPTRMQYAQAVPAVQYVAKTLSETLSRWNGGDEA